ncbi:hypothetical protein SAMN04487776_10166 [Priestia megaterium]|nr:hypothetical protein SAMN04487776_10166 [Priestia megaterium]
MLVMSQPLYVLLISCRYQLFLKNLVKTEDERYF